MHHSLSFISGKYDQIGKNNGKLLEENKRLKASIDEIRILKSMTYNRKIIVERFPEVDPCSQSKEIQVEVASVIKKENFKFNKILNVKMMPYKNRDCVDYVYEVEN